MQLYFMLDMRCDSLYQRYGIAVGPVSMGVLQGKRPAFDIWGKTVNLAARMEVASMSFLQCFVSN